MSFCLRRRGTIPVRISVICVAFKPFMSLLQARLWPEFLSTTMSLLPLGVARITNFPILHTSAFKFQAFCPFAYGTTYVQRTVEKVVLVILLLDSVMSALVHGWRRCTADASVIRRVPISASQVACTLKVALDLNCDRVRRYTQLYK